jgi:hypothetical protein
LNETLNPYYHVSPFTKPHAKIIAGEEGLSSSDSEEGTILAIQVLLPPPPPIMMLLGPTMVAQVADALEWARRCCVKSHP